jgi:hypothetical protein
MIMTMPLQFSLCEAVASLVLLGRRLPFLDVIRSDYLSTVAAVKCLASIGPNYYTSKPSSVVVCVERHRSLVGESAPLTELSLSSESFQDQVRTMIATRLGELKFTNRSETHELSNVMEIVGFLPIRFDGERGCFCLGRNREFFGIHQNQAPKAMIVKASQRTFGSSSSSTT